MPDRLGWTYGCTCDPGQRLFLVQGSIAWPAPFRNMAGVCQGEVHVAVSLVVEKVTDASISFVGLVSVAPPGPQ